MGFLALLQDFLFQQLLPVLAHEYALKRETDPAYRAASDAAYAAVKSATTTADKDAASRKLYELQKSAKSS